MRNAEYRFASTAPTNPHYYTLLSTWDKEEEFWECDDFMRDNGYPTLWHGHKYIYFDIDGWHYWNLPKPDRQRIKLINRCKKPYPKRVPFSAPNPELQERIAQRLCDMKLGRVLEIGFPESGTVLTAVDIHPDDYIGIDTDSIAVSQAEYDHPQHLFVRTCLSDHYRRYDTILALWGSASRIPGHALDRIPLMLNPGGQAILMFDEDPGLQFGEKDTPFHGFVVRKIINADLHQEDRP
jgi:hypothetical protein